MAMTDDFTKLLMMTILVDDIHQLIDELHQCMDCIAFVCVSSLDHSLVWLAPGTMNLFVFISEL